jgi:hypothetical protein
MTFVLPGRPSVVMLQRSEEQIAAQQYIHRAAAMATQWKS